MHRITILAILLAILSCAAGCGGYGEVSPAAYDYSMALYAISNRQASDKLDSVGQQITASQTAGELTGREAAWLADIIDDARRGDWQGAAQASRRMMEDQVERSR